MIQQSAKYFYLFEELLKSDIQNESSLQLDIGGQYTVQVINSLADKLGKCLNLTTLIINLVGKLFNQGTSNLQLLFQKCSNLQILSLDLRTNQIKSDHITDRGFGLSQCQNLRRLTIDLTFNQIGGKGMQKIGQDLEKCVNLTDLVLILSGNNINDEGIFNFCSCIENCSQLTKLNIFLGEAVFLDAKFRNFITNQGLLNIGGSLVKLSNLVTLKLDFSGNCIDDEGLFAFSLLIEKCSTLKYLSLNFWKIQEISQQGKFSITSILRFCPNIIVLELYFQRKLFSQKMVFVKCLKNLRKMQRVVKFELEV
ncbi:hypothetical protein ABPG74_006597 [Tetrahymena malaccensis]